MKKYYLLMLLAFQLASVTKIYSQNIAINGTGSLPDTSAMLDVSSTNKGFLAPRMTTAQQNAIPLPANGLLIFNTTDNGFKVNTGTAASPVWTALSVGSGTTTNTLTYSNNILTSTTNGVGASVNIINEVSNSSANNVLSTSVNGISGSGVSIINSNALSLSGTNLTSTINGVASGGVNLSSIVPATTNTLGSSANTMTNTINGVAATAPIVNTNALALSGTTLTSTINGVASGGVNLSGIVPATTNTLGSSANTMTNTTNGIAATAPIVNTNALALSGTTLTSTINGIASGGVNLTPVVAAATTNTLSSAVNTLTNTTNGVAATAPIVNTNALALSGTTLTSTINGVASGGVNLSGIVPATTNTLGSSANTMTNTTNGIAATAPIVNTNALALSGTTLTSTINGIASGGVNLSSIVPATTNTLNSSVNTLTNTTNGIAATAPIVNTNVLALSGTNLTATINGIASNSINIASASTEPWYNVATNTSATSNTQNIYQSANVGIGVTDPATQLVVKDNIEIRRVATVAQLLFSNTAGTGDFRFGGDGGDIYWQGGGGRSLQMGSYWATILGGDRQNASFPSFVNGVTGTSVIVQSMRDASVALGIQANSGSQTANLTEWRNSGGTVLSVIDKSGNLGIGKSTPGSSIDVKGTLRLSGSSSGYVGFAPASAAGSTTYVLPSADGTSGQQLTTNGSGTLSWASAASSAGTVSTVSVATANGFSGNVATAGTTPVITLTTGVTGLLKGNGTAISAATAGTDYLSPTGSAAALTNFPTFNQNTTGTAANITGVLNAVSHPALTGDVTNASGSLSTTIANNVVTVGKMQQIATNSLLGRSTSATGNVEVISVGSGLSLTGGTLTATGGTGSVTSASVATANGFTGTVATASTTPVITLTTNVTGLLKGNGTAISAATAGTDYLSPTGSAAALTNFPTFNQNTTGTAANITGVLNAVSHPALTGDVTNASGSLSTTIANNVVTVGKMQQIATNSLLGRSTSATGNVEVISVGSGLSLTGGTLTATGGTGSVTSASVATANGFTGTVATASTTPVITLTTNVTGLLKGNGTAISSAIAGTDYLQPTGSAAALTNFPTFNQNTTGNAATVTTNANLTGDVSSVGNATTIGASKVTNAMLAGSIDLTTKVTGVLPVANGGTGLSSAATGDLLYASATNTWSKLAAGTNGYVLTLAGGVPTWAVANGGSGSSASGWGLTGNASTDSSSNFIGTTDAKPFQIRTNNANRLTINSATGFIGIATTTPSSTLDVEGSFGTNISKQTGAATLDNTAAVWYFTGSGSITLPSASTCTNRRYVIVNRTGSSKSFSGSSFNNLSGTSTSSISQNSSIEIISDGSNWLQIK